MADWHEDESYYDLGVGLELLESDISLCSDEISSLYIPHHVLKVIATSKMLQLRPPYSFVAESSTNFPAVSQSGDDISTGKYQPPHSETEGLFHNFFHWFGFSR